MLVARCGFSEFGLRPEGEPGRGRAQGGRRGRGAHVAAPVLVHAVPAVHRTRRELKIVVSAMAAVRGGAEARGSGCTCNVQLLVCKRRVFFFPFILLSERITSAAYR